MSTKETNQRVIDNPVRDPNYPAFVRLTDIPGKHTTLILQRFMTTMIETSICRDEALALAQAIIRHFDVRPEELAEEMKKQVFTRVVLVSGPRGCGKTKFADQIREHFKADYCVEGDEWGAIETIKALKGSAECIVILTSNEGAALHKMIDTLIHLNLRPVHNHFNDVMGRIQTNCDHNWQRRICPDIYQEDYLSCSKCGATKP